MTCFPGGDRGRLHAMPADRPAFPSLFRKPSPLIPTLALLLMPVVVDAQWILEDPTDRAMSIIDRLDRPPSSFGIRSGFRDGNQSREHRDDQGIGIGNQEAPTTFRETAGGGVSSGGSYIHATPGSPAELSVGETRLVGGNALVPPREVFIGRRIRVDGLVDHGPGNGASFDVEEESSVPGSGPIVSSGTQVRTRIHLPENGTQNYYGHDDESDFDTRSSGLSLTDGAVPGAPPGPGLPGSPPPQPRTRRSRNGTVTRSRSNGQNSRSRTGWIGIQRLDPAAR